MTYLEFHLWFTCPVFLLSLMLIFPLFKKFGWRGPGCALLNALLSLIYTTPWDNYLVYKGIWFYGPDRIIGTLGYVPIEEYLFFILQSLMGSWLILWWWNPPLDHKAPTSNTRIRAGLFFYGFLFLIGLFCLTQDQSLYLGLILVWAMPVLMLGWWIIGDLIVRDIKPLLTSFSALTCYLWIADHYAITHGIWSLSEKYTLGIQFWGLPLEEAIFFAVTNLLLVQGVVLFIDPAADARIRKLLSHKKNGPS